MKSKNREIIVVGDRVLLKQAKRDNMTEVGLILPQTVIEKEKVQTGMVVSVGPGTPVPSLGVEEDEPWKEEMRQQKFVPLQAEPGDYAIYLKKHAVEITFDGQEYMIVPQGAILILLRDLPE